MTAAGGWLRALLRPRLRRVEVGVALLLALLGFAVAVQVRATQDQGVLASARQEDLVAILNDLSNRSTRLRQEIASLTATQQRLTTGTGQDAAALADARRRAQVLGVLAGTLPARGPGVTLTISDPSGKVGAEVLLDALEELRDAGAEALQISGSATGATPAGPTVRIVASTAFVDSVALSGVTVDGTVVQAPYRFTVIGDPATLAAAMAIPGGVLDTVAQRGGQGRVVRSTDLLVSALRPLSTPRYARPAG